MHFEPTNRHILVKPLKQKESEADSLIMLPQDYKKPESPYQQCEVLNIAGDSKFISSLKKGDIILIEQRMLQKIEFGAKEIYLILENYVLGRIKHET